MTHHLQPIHARCMPCCARSGCILPLKWTVRACAPSGDSCCCPGSRRWPRIHRAGGTVAVRPANLLNPFSAVSNSMLRLHADSLVLDMLRQEEMRHFGYALVLITTRFCASKCTIAPGPVPWFCRQRHSAVRASDPSLPASVHHGCMDRYAGRGHPHEQSIPVRNAAASWWPVPQV